MDCILASLPSFNFSIPIMSLIWGKQGRLWQLSSSQIAMTHRCWCDSDKCRAMGYTPEGPWLLCKDGELFWEDVAAILYLTGRRVYRDEDKGTVGRGNSMKRCGVSGDLRVAFEVWRQSCKLETGNWEGCADGWGDFDGGGASSFVLLHQSAKQ